MDQRELDSFAHMCFRDILERHNPKSRYVHRKKHRLEELKVEAQQEFLSRNETKVFDNGLINLENFTVACSCNDPIPFESVIALFDSDRRMSTLEWHFTPKHIQKCILENRSQCGADADDAPPPVTLGNEAAVDVKSKDRQNNANVDEADASPTGLCSPELRSTAFHASLEADLPLTHPETLEQRKRTARQTRQAVDQLIQKDHSRSLEVAASTRERATLQQEVRRLAEVVDGLTTRLAAAEAHASSYEAVVAVERAGLEIRFDELTDELYKRLGEVALQFTAGPVIQGAASSGDPGREADPPLHLPAFVAKTPSHNAIAQDLAAGESHGLSDRALAEACPGLLSRIESLESFMKTSPDAGAAVREQKLEPSASQQRPSPSGTRLIDQTASEPDTAESGPLTANGLWSDRSILAEYGNRAPQSPSLPSERGQTWSCTGSKHRSCIGFVADR